MHIINNFENNLHKWNFKWVHLIKNIFPKIGTRVIKCFYISIICLKVTRLYKFKKLLFIKFLPKYSWFTKNIDNNISI